MNMTIDITDIKIKIKLINSTKLLAQATVILFDIWEEHGWKILSSTKLNPDYNEELWIQAPSYHVFTGWKELIFINDEALYKSVLNKIYVAYKYALEKQNSLPDEGSAVKEKISMEEVDEFFKNQ